MKREMMVIETKMEFKKMDRFMLFKVKGEEMSE